MYRVYMVYNTPLEGCEDYFDVVEITPIIFNKEKL